MNKKRIGITMLTLCYIVMIAGCNNMDEKKDTITQSLPITETENKETQGEFEAVSEVYQTEDKKITAQIIRYIGDDKDILRIIKEKEEITELLLDDEMTSQILSVKWLNNNKYLAITSHVNPSTNQYLTVDLENDYEMKTYYGFDFVWNSDWSNFYYIQAAPHFSEDTEDALVDKNGNIFYKTEGGNRLSGGISITPDEKYFMCEIYTPEDKNILLILEKQDEQMMLVVANIMDYTGIPAFIDNETLTLSEGDKVQTFKISDLVN